MSRARPLYVLVALASASCFMLLSLRPRLPQIQESVGLYRSQQHIHTPHFATQATPMPMPSTQIPGGAHAYGYTLFDNLYLRNGTFYVVTEERSRFPALDALLSAPLDLEKDADLKANDSHLQFISPHAAVEMLGTSRIRLDEFTVIVYDPKQFMTHYYHWWGEIILGFWRVYSMLGWRLDDRFSSLPFPKRFFLPFVTDNTWRDRAGVNGPLMRAANPAVSIETSSLWKDLIDLDETVVFTRAALINRPAAHRHSLGKRWSKMMSSTMELPIPLGFWEPLRKTVLAGYGLSMGPWESKKPIVTYISRQSTGRHLITEDHEGLVRSLRQLEEEGLCDVLIPVMERLRLKEQMELASRTTIMVGVHGNGLTHQLWMPPSAQSTVIEIMVPDGYVFDYEILARNMGHQHYAVWNDTFLTYPKGQTHQGISQPPGFHGNYIPVYGPTVATIIRGRLSEQADFD